VLCDELRGKRLDKAKQLLEDLIAQKRSLNGKYYTKAARTILQVLKDAEANARVKGLGLERLFVKQAKADKGYRLITPKSRWRFRRRGAKVTHLEIILEER
jgi:ribosomal protein L22